jgi:hypothetical protein
VDADDGIVSADTDAYFNSLDGNQGDVTQERNDPEPTALPRWVSDILNAFGPGLCSGDGIPCYLKQKGPLDLTVGNLTGGGYGVHAQYVYTVEDIFGNPTPVDSVTEWLTVLAATSNAPTPNPSTWTGDNLPLGCISMIILTLLAHLRILTKLLWFFRHSQPVWEGTRIPCSIKIQSKLLTDLAVPQGR